MASEPGDVAGLMALSAVVGGAATWLANLYFKIRGERRKESIEDDTTAVGRYREMHDRLLAQIDRYEAHIREQDGMMMRLIRAEQTCQVRLTEYWGHLARMHDAMIHAGLGQHIPEMPPPPRRDGEYDGLEFEARQTAQDSATLTTASEKLKSQSPRGGDVRESPRGG